VLHYLKGTPKPLWKSYFSSKKEQDYIRQDITTIIDTYINKTPRLYSDDAVHAAFKQNKFDAVIVGSDQCWRPKYSPNIYTYYLDFLKDNKDIKKLAYAASFGTDDWEYTEEQTVDVKSPMFLLNRKSDVKKILEDERMASASFLTNALSI